jgi:hypothetical protein
LPSKDELNEVCKYARNTGQAPGASTRCAGGSTATLRGFSEDYYYWSSSETASTGSRAQFFANGDLYSVTRYSELYVRPVRAF